MSEPFALLGRDLFGDPVKPSTRPGPLAQRFTVPPFTVLNARDGAWQERKRAWIGIGIESETGRSGDIVPNGSSRPPEQDGCYMRRSRKSELLGLSESARRLAGGYTEQDGTMKASSGTSIFDPVLCELSYSWFCPAAGHVLDPFAGGSVRGIVAALLGRRYTGIELRPEQITANREQAARICGAIRPEWIEGDSRNAAAIAPGSYDFVFSCPPYGDLERYSDDPRDLSTLDHDAFAVAYAEVIAAAVALLRPDRFACFVVGDYRDKKGIYRGFPAETCKAFERAGCALYNEAILVTSVGSLPIRVGKQFTASRKLGKTHQNVLVFVKGDPRLAAAACEGEGHK